MKTRQSPILFKKKKTKKYSLNVILFHVPFPRFYTWNFLNRFNLIIRLLSLCICPHWLFSSRIFHLILAFSGPAALTVFSLSYTLIQAIKIARWKMSTKRKIDAIFDFPGTVTFSFRVSQTSSPANKSFSLPIIFFRFIELFQCVLPREIFRWME